MKKINAILILLSFSIVFWAQQTKKLSLEDVISGGKNYRQFIPEYKKYNFRGNSDNVVWIKPDSILQVQANNTFTHVLSLNEVNDVLKANELNPLKSLWGVKWVDYEKIWFDNGNAIIVLNIDARKVETAISYPKGSLEKHYNLKANALAYVYHDSLFVADENNESILIEEGNENVKIGTSVHRNEFGIHNGIFWSPNGESLAFYRKDESMVTDYPMVNINERVASLENIKYPMAGMKSHHVIIGVYNFKSNDKVYLNTGEPKEKYLTNVTWDNTGNQVLVAELNRGQNHMVLNKYDAQTGKMLESLFEEKSDQWVEPESPALFIPESNRFIWQSERDGFNHLYIYDISRGFVKQLTKGNWVVTDVLGFDSSAKYLFFESTKDQGVLNRHIFKVALSSGKITRITQVQGVHHSVLSHDGSKIIDMYSNVNTPRVIQVVDTKKKKANNLLNAKNPFEQYNIGKIVMDTIKSADGVTDLYTRMILPPNFDKSKKYPVVVYVYGGPHAQLVKNSWLGSARLWQLYMAQQGYIAFTLDNRGTPDRGCDFEKVIHRQLGEKECEDQMEGVKYLKQFPYVDVDRIGVHGWSFGGFMTINLMEKYPDIFKVGVSGGPVTDWKYYEIMYGERYMDMPEENEEGYKQSNLNLRTKELEGRLLVIHGAIDPTVVWQHSLYFIEQCIKTDKQVDYFVYPRHKHNVLGEDRVHLMQKVTNYFNDFL